MEMPDVPGRPAVEDWTASGEDSFLTSWAEADADMMLSWRWADAETYAIMSWKNSPPINESMLRFTWPSPEL